MMDYQKILKDLDQTELRIASYSQSYFGEDSIVLEDVKLLVGTTLVGVVPRMYLHKASLLELIQTLADQNDLPPPPKE